MLQKGSLYNHNPLIQTRSLRIFEERVKLSGLIWVFDWKVLNVFYHVKKVKGPVMPGQAIVFRGSVPGSPFGRGSLPNLLYSNGFILKWAHLMRIPTQATFWRCKWATKHKWLNQLPETEWLQNHIHPPLSTVQNVPICSSCANPMFENYQWISKGERPSRFFPVLMDLKNSSLGNFNWLSQSSVGTAIMWRNLTLF